MATAQKRGFRLPWGGDSRHPEPPPDPSHDDETVDETDVAQRLRIAVEDLGHGPFALGGSTATTASKAPAAEADDDALLETAAAPASEPAIDETGDDAPLETAGTETLDTVRAAWPESDRRTAGPLAAIRQPGAVPPPRATAPAAPRAAAPAPERNATPEPDDAPAPTPAPAPAREGPRRDNPLVAGLVRAMRDAARTTRDEAVATLHAEATARGDAIRAQSADTATELKKTAEADVAAVKDRSRAELARVREETEARIAARKTQLVAEIEAEARSAEERVGSLRAAIEAFESEMAAFFEALIAEDDPARLAGLAERMPTPPSFDAFPGTGGKVAHAPRPRRTATAKPSSPRAQRAARGAPEPVEVPEATMEPEPAVEAEAAAQAPEPEAEAEATVHASEPEPVEVPDAAIEPEPEIAAAPEASSSPADDAPPDPTAWLEHLGPDAAAAAEAEALAGLDVQTQLVVAGLSSVAAIAMFKAALMQVQGVSAVSVTAGTTGDFLFIVTHDGRTDLRDALRSMEAFITQVIADDGTTVSLVAREPAA